MKRLDLETLDPENAAAVRRHVAAETAFDMEGTLATLTENCVFEDVPTGEVYHGREGARAYYREWWDAFANVPSASRLYVPAADRLIVETRFIGTHRGRFRGAAPTGRPIDLPIAIFIGFRGGLLTGERFYYDRATLLAQIGAA
ncbi:MAG: ester cyclase [Candidatus Rokubacteria bacterium]|nr:ester cyclase [Candidatus Rokubacteria bacterium]